MWPSAGHEPVRLDGPAPNPGLTPAVKGPQPGDALIHERHALALVGPQAGDERRVHVQRLAGRALGWPPQEQRLHARGQALVRVLPGASRFGGRGAWCSAWMRP